MSFSAATAAWIAIGAAAGAALTLLLAGWIWLRVRRLKVGQAGLLGGGEADLVGFAVSLQGRIGDLHRAVDEVGAGAVRVEPRQGKAEVIEELDQPLRSATDTYPRPHVIRLVQYVRVPRTLQRKISRRALFARDGWRCMYCGTNGGKLTLDHVVPRSRGGDSVWENVVTSCAPCNMRKGNRLLHEISMELRELPRVPTPVLFIRLAAPSIPQRWQPYLEAFQAA